MSSTLRSTDRPLAQLHDVALLDLDGVVYVGKDAVPGAPAALAAARAQGTRLAFVTNNAARPPSAVAAHLTELGIAAEPDEVINSAQAAARYLADHLPAGSRVLVLGTAGLFEALSERGLESTSEASEDVVAVVQGYSPTMDWALLAEGTVAINRGALWVATNADPTVPSPRGPLPGNGSMVAALRLATGSEPVVTGKPDPTMHRETVIRTGARRPIVVGDRLDTDIEGATAVGCPSLLVFSGVTGAADLLSAPQALRPTYLGADVGALLLVHPQPQQSGSAAVCGRWSATLEGDDLVLDLVLDPIPGGTDAAVGAPRAGAGPADRDGPPPVVFDDDTLDAIRALCAARWARGPEGGGPPRVRADTPDAVAVLQRLGLTDRPRQGERSVHP